MDRRTYLGTVGTASLSALAGCASISSGSQEFDVGMTAVAFEPTTVTVSVGEAVVWHNTSSRAHTVTAYEDGLPDGASFFASGEFESEQAARDAFYADFGGAIASDQSYRHTFEVPGTYPYFCIPHEQGGMVGKVVVEE
jgi:plastocyanin